MKKLGSLSKIDLLFLDGAGPGPLPENEGTLWLAETELDNNLCAFVVSAEKIDDSHLHNFEVQVASVIYDRQASIQLREMLIKIRNTAVVNNRWDDAIVLSHVISWMAKMMEAVTVTDSNRENGQ